MNICLFDDSEFVLERGHFTDGNAYFVIRSPAHGTFTLFERPKTLEAFVSQLEGALAEQRRVIADKAAKR